MKKTQYKKGNQFNTSTNEEFQPQVEGKPWKVTLKCSTFEEADAKRQLLKKKWAESELKGAEVKVKKSNASGLYSVRVRVPEAPKPAAKVKEVLPGKPKKAKRQQRDEKRGKKKRAEKESAWKKLKDQNESNPS
jgi:DNA helicase IV|tara:strand:- start:613 stop:1014 length:402 start_codon:yes stop_codon:yes gene_type:complete